MALVRIRAKIEKNTLLGRALVRIRAKIEKKHHCLVGLCLEKGQKYKKKLFGRALVRIRAKI